MRMVSTSVAASATMPVPVRRRTPQDITGRARRVLDAAMSVTSRWPRDPGARQKVRQAADDLDTALDNFGAVESRVVTWEAFYPHLSAVADPDGEALERLAEECAHAEGALLMAITATSGKQLADEIKNAATEGGTPGGEK